MVTAGTYRKYPLFQDEEALKALHGGLLKYANEFGWQLDAWAVFPNHYHFIGHSPDASAESLSQFMRVFHQKSASWLNQRDGKIGRKVWHNYWETRLTIEGSFYARLGYVHLNAVKHGVVKVAAEYPWCSAKWFEGHAAPETVRSIYGIPTDQLNIKDDFDLSS